MNEQKLQLADLASGLSRRASLPLRYSEEFVSLFFKTIEEGLLHDNMVKVKGFGTFKLVDVEARESINVNSGERFEIAGHTKVSFTPDTVLRDAINKPFVEFETVVINDGVDMSAMEATEETPKEQPSTSNADAPAIEVAEPVAIEAADAPATEPSKGKAVERQQPSLSEKAIEPIVNVEPTKVEEQVPTEVQHQEEKTIQNAVCSVVADKAEKATPIATTEQQAVMKPCAASSESAASVHGDAEGEDASKTPHSRHSSRHLFLGIVLAFLCTALGYCLGYYWHPIALPEFGTSSTDVMAVSSDDNKGIESDNQTVDTLSGAADEQASAAQADAIPTADDTQNDDSQQSASDYPQLEGGEYLIVGVLTTDTMKVGKTLTNMAIQYYGDKYLYPYICVMNGIDNPDVVPLNKPLVIPKIQKK